LPSQAFFAIESQSGPQSVVFILHSDQVNDSVAVLYHYEQRIFQLLGKDTRTDIPRGLSQVQECMSLELKESKYERFRITKLSNGEM